MMGDSDAVWNVAKLQEDVLGYAAWRDYPEVGSEPLVIGIGDETDE